jgi:hypothetical protein
MLEVLGLRRVTVINTELRDGNVTHQSVVPFPKNAVLMRRVSMTAPVFPDAVKIQASTSCAYCR